MNITQLAIYWSLIMLALCVVGCVAEWLIKRPLRNRRVRLPCPFRDNRSSLEHHRRMYGK